ncbi:hypothetical protein SERLA73DRAFT_136036 [Serpula lacrymans var. lacrymans S7.3]|uniref:Uncharacterized protein n=2 Tax=Serpula lacrymans var. lacrymans TaxID=341189 RepID=F8PW98_SERL3|nr:uncharacterized protein SERLADRAFT_388367 [Serpula lacrymans var. lacrymans S7.9]EGO00274.1 hypothetical protein SERLA73DRAFT_136036 [Serpula lacrymans var. lacrymans S7.3]EGO25831.1 hypothetical protein SERLADRAFT_388367 [Serpula lacrymans var. lacrymans S7.9]
MRQTRYPSDHVAAAVLEDHKERGRTKATRKVTREPRRQVETDVRVREIEQDHRMSGCIAGV